MENFYITNHYFPYEEILYRGEQQYLYQKFLNKDFHFLVHVKNTYTKESESFDLPASVQFQHFSFLFNSIITDNLTPELNL